MKVVNKVKMDNLIYEGEDIHLAQQDYDNYGDCKTPDTSRVGEP